MSGSFEINPATGKIEIIRDGRKVLDTAGTLINLLPSGGFNSTINMVFPDFTKDHMYRWRWQSTYSFLASTYGWLSEGVVAITAPPQEWSQTTVLMSAPTGADIFWSKIKLNQTDAPSHSWSGSNVLVPLIQNDWMPFAGSGLIEAGLGMTRAFSIYIENGDLVLHQQQSVGEHPEFNPIGDASVAFMANRSGTSFGYSTQKGLIVYSPNVSPFVKASSGTSPNLPATQVNTHKWNGSNPCSTSDPTDYSTTYSVEIDGQFGNRSKVA